MVQSPSLHNQRQCKLSHILYQDPNADCLYRRDAVEVAKLKEELGTQGTRLREMEKGLRAIHDMAQNMAAKSADILAGGTKKVSEASKPAFKAPEPSNGKLSSPLP